MTTTEYPPEITEMIANRAGLYLAIARYDDPPALDEDVAEPPWDLMDQYDYRYESTAMDVRLVLEEWEKAAPGRRPAGVEVFEPLDTDLGREGDGLGLARAQLSLATQKAQAAAIRARESGVTETRIATTLGVDRMTVRKWLGK